MAHLFATGRIADLIIALSLVEGGLLTWYYRRTGRGIAPSDALPNLLAGIALVAALRLALSGAGWPAIATCLLAALAAHLADLRRRWRR